MDYRDLGNCSEPGCRFLHVPNSAVCEKHGGKRPARAPDRPMDAPGMRLCGATTRTGGRCEQPARRGTSRCPLHGGNSPRAQNRAKEVVAQAIIEADARHYGEPRSISAIDALVEELNRTQGTLIGSVSRSRRDRRTPACWPSTRPSAHT
jgi:hypothetical protein